MKSKTFKFQLSVNSLPCVNPLWPEDAHASEIISDMVTDAIMHVLEMKMNYIAQNHIQDVVSLTGHQKDFWNYLEQKENLYKEIRSTIIPFETINDTCPNNPPTSK